VVLADFVSPSSGVRVSAKRRNKPTHGNSSPHSSATPSACNEGFSKNPRTHLAPKECLVGSPQGSPQSGSGNPTRGSSPVPSSQQYSGQDCSSSTPPSGSPSADDPISASRAPATPLSAGHSGPASDIPPGNPNPSPSSLVHFPDFAQLESCHLNKVHLGVATPMWHYFLIRYVAGKFPGYASLLHFISKH